MNYKKFSHIYSIARTYRYLKAANNDKIKAQSLYYANARLAMSFQPLLSTFEVVLRNQLHYALAGYFSDVEWIINQKSGFMSDPSLKHKDKRTHKYVLNDFLKKEVEKAEFTLLNDGKQVTSGRVIAELNLGFWNSMYEKHHYAILKGIPGSIFNGLPTGYGRKKINDVICQIRCFRNRISHNEPICFQGKTFDLQCAKEMYKLIVDFLSWIDPKIMDDLTKEHLDNVLAEITNAELILK